MKLIDADAIEKAVRKRVYAIEVDDILAEIANAPSIDIVFCKECKLYEECEYLELGDDDFCSRGEREGE